jgi:hypothetical protein
MYSNERRPKSIYKNQYRELNKKIIKDIFELRTMYDTDYIINIVI